MFSAPQTPAVYHVYTFEGATLIKDLQSALEVEPNTFLVTFGFTPSAISRTIDLLKKEQFLNFPKSGAALNKLFQE